MLGRGPSRARSASPQACPAPPLPRSCRFWARRRAPPTSCSADRRACADRTRCRDACGPAPRRAWRRRGPRRAATGASQRWMLAAWRFALLLARTCNGPVRKYLPGCCSWPASTSLVC
eukprot:scaffold1531_cov296-Prasinococcus_capsulatus_cf.AAC.13